MLREARSLGTELVVILANDAHNRKPAAAPAAKRLAWMREAGVADRVVVGRPDGFVRTLRQEKPDIIALGYDQGLPDEATRSAVRDMGIEVVRMPWFAGKSTVLWPRS